MIELGQADAIWYCCSGHENTLLHFAGAYSFNYIKRYRCEHVVCQRYYTTASGLLQALPEGHSKCPTEEMDLENKPTCRH
jgi:hypothetical protein